MSEPRYFRNPKPAIRSGVPGRDFLLPISSGAISFRRSGQLGRSLIFRISGSRVSDFGLRISDQVGACIFVTGL